MPTPAYFRNLNAIIISIDLNPLHYNPVNLPQCPYGSWQFLPAGRRSRRHGRATPRRTCLRRLLSGIVGGSQVRVLCKIDHPMPSSGAGGGTGRSWYCFHMSGFAWVANASSDAGGGTGKDFNFCVICPMI